MSRFGFNVAVVGATGAVGEQIVSILEERSFPVKSLKLLASGRSEGKKMMFRNKEITIEKTVPDSFEGIDLAFFTAGSAVSKEFVPEAVKRNAIVIDNTSAFRMYPNVPLVVPEVNEADLKNHSGIIANPNCSTIQMVVALEPIRHHFGLSRVIVSTYQSTSGAGKRFIEEMYSQSLTVIKNKTLGKDPVYQDPDTYPIAFNVIPQIDRFVENDYTFEEMKMCQETKKIMHLPELKISATCVRIPVERGHSEAVYFEVEDTDVDAQEIKNVLSVTPGIQLIDNPEERKYPMPYFAKGKKEVFVGRIRKDLDIDRGFHMWVVADNLLKGAAWNSVQIAESLLKMRLLPKKSK